MDDQGLANGVAGGPQDVPMGPQTSSGVLDATGGGMPQMTEANGAVPPVVNNGAPMPEMGTAILPPAPAPQVDEMTMPGMSGGTDPLAAATEALATDAAAVAVSGAVSEPVPGVATEATVGTNATAGAAPAMETTETSGLENVAGGDVLASENPEVASTEQATAETGTAPAGGETTGATDELMGAAAELAGAATAEAQANMQEVNQATPTPSIVESAQATVTEQPVKEKKKFDLGGLFKKKEAPAAEANAGAADAAPGAENKGEKQSFSEWFANANFSDLLKPRQPKNVSGIAESFEINLVPSIKAEALAAAHTRNLILFVCIVIVASIGGLVAVLGSIHGAKSIQMSGQDSKLEEMSKKINSFDGLEEYVTVQEQLDGIAKINENRQVLSRIFPFLEAMRPDAPDSITFSEMSISMETNRVTLSGTADAGVEPLIDYRVLEAFKKSTEQMTYDYGNYVDKDDNEIPTRCMVENGKEGGTLVSRDTAHKRDVTYAYWMVTKSGCDVNWSARDEAIDELEDEILAEEAEARVFKNSGSKSEEDDEEDSDEKSRTSLDLDLDLDLSPDSDSSLDTDLSSDTNSNKSNNTGRYKEIYDEYNETTVKTWYDEWLERVGLTRYTDSNLSEQQVENREASWNEYYEKLNDEEKWIADKMVNENGVRRQDVYFEKVYRTPLFEEWSKENEDGEAYMTTSGEISGVPHFQSACSTYTGTEMGNGQIMWTTETSDECTLIDGEMETTSSNGRRDGNLVLQFEASFTLNKEPMNFNNKHMMAIAPGGKNVTDSYVQIEGMFGKAAEDCQSTDVVCTSNGDAQNKDGGDNAD